MPPNQQPPPIPAHAAVRVPSYLAWSILVTLFCCLPIGIVAIVYSAKVNSRLASGDYEGTLRASRSARNRCIVSMIAGVLLFTYAAYNINKSGHTRERGYDAITRSFLRNLATAQEGYYANNSTYTNSLDGLRAMGLNLEPNVSYTLTVSPDGESWSAQAWSPKGTGRFRISTSGGGVEKVQ